MSTAGAFPEDTSAAPFRPNVDILFRLEPSLVGLLRTPDNERTADAAKSTQLPSALKHIPLVTVMEYVAFRVELSFTIQRCHS